MIVILSVIILFLLLYKYAWPKKKYWENRGLVAYKIKAFFSMNGVVHQMGDVYEKMKDEGQRVAGLYLTWEKVLFVTDVQIMQNIPKCAKVENKVRDIKAANTFDAVLIAATNLVLALQEVAKSDAEIDFGDLSTRYTAEIMTSLVFGGEFNKLTSGSKAFKIRNMSLRAGAHSLRSLVKQFISVRFPRFAQRFAFFTSTRDATAHKFFMKTIQEAIESRKQSAALRHDFLQSLLDAENADGEKMQMTVEEIGERVMSCFAAGVETSAVAIGYSLIEIKRNSSVESKLRGEVCSVLEKYNCTLSCEALDEMIYLNAVIKETLRMYPPVPILKETTSETYTLLPNIDIEKGTNVATSILAMLRDAENVDEPDVFNPERAAKDIEQKVEALLRQSTKFDLPLMILQCKISLALILWNFDYEISERTKYPLEIDAPNGVLIPKNKIRLKFSPLITSL